MAAKRSTQMTIIGVSVFIIGAGLVFLGLHSKKATPAAAPAPTQSAPVGTTVHAAGVGTTSVPIVIPDGFTAVAVKLDSVAGVAGHVSPGDLINLYATVKSGDVQKGLTPPYSKLVLSKVRVLDVTGVAADGSGDPTFLLALTPADAERAIFFAKFESMWATLVPTQQKPASTAGIDYANDLAKR
jgi:Flp pilus assembly protein RcpC/CpaB